MSISTTTATAPGRLDVMGGIADYSGSWVLQMPIGERATVRVAFRNDELLRAVSADEPVAISLKISELPTDFEEARHFFRREKGGEWAAYVLGCLVVLRTMRGLPLRQGLDFEVLSDVPIGKGVSSSAALEVATLRALAQLFDLKFEGTELARLAQVVENQVVGAPCGLMDQLASCFGQPGHLLPIRCQPDQLAAPLPLPPGVRFVGIDSGIRHAVSGSSYADVRSAAFMGLRIIERELGLRLGGYLCRLGPAEFEQRCAPVLPEGMRGGEFLERYGSTGDTATRVEPDRVYRVRNCARHPVHENFRVRSFGKLLLQSIDNESLTLLGELMYQSHGSYSAVGLGHARTDEIVEMARATGPGSGVFGAKVTGGGSGGTVCLGCHGDEGLATARRICEDYRRRHGEEVTFFAA